MSLAYVGVARISSSGYPTILAECQTDGVAPTSAEVKVAFSDLGTNPSGKTSVPSDRFTYHLSSQDVPSAGEFPLTLAFIVAVPSNVTPAADRQSCFRFLDRLSNELLGGGSEEALLQTAKTAGDRGLQNELAGNMKELMTRFNRGEGNVSGKVDTLRDQVRDVRQVMEENVERVLVRGDRLDELQDRSTDLEASASQFRSTSRRVRQSMCRKNAKWTIIGGVVAAIFLLVIVLVILWQTGIL